MTPGEAQGFFHLCCLEKHRSDSTGDRKLAMPTGSDSRVFTALHGGFLGSPGCTPRGECARLGCSKVRLLARTAEAAACQPHGADAPLAKASKPWDMSFLARIGI